MMAGVKSIVDDVCYRGVERNAVGGNPPDTDDVGPGVRQVGNTGSRHLSDDQRLYPFPSFYSIH